MLERALVLVALAAVVAVWALARLWRAWRVRRLRSARPLTGWAPAGRPAVIAFSTPNCADCRQRQALALARLARPRPRDGPHAVGVDHPALVRQPRHWSRRPPSSSTPRAACATSTSACAGGDAVRPASLTCSELPIGWVGRGGFETRPRLGPLLTGRSARSAAPASVEVGEGVGEGAGGCGVGVPLVAVGQAARGKNFWTRGCDLGDVDAALTVDGDAADGGELADVVAKNAPVRQVAVFAVEDIRTRLLPLSLARITPDGSTARLIPPPNSAEPSRARPQRPRKRGRRRRSAGCAATGRRRR